jgi:hypothetical protein
LTRSLTSVTGRRHLRSPTSFCAGSLTTAPAQSADRDVDQVKRYDDAIVEANRFNQRHGEDLIILDALKVSYFYTGKIEEAIRYGQRGLTLRDAQACRNPPATAMVEPQGAPVGTDAISFSLWGPAPFYSCGAMINLVLSGSIYPGWTCRFYVGADVPRACVAFLADNGADIRHIADEYPGVGLFQRFLVMNDPAAGRFLVRDCDARLSPAEANLVRQWIDSGFPFHVVREHVLHNELMIGCLWGGRTDCGIDIVALMRRYCGRCRQRNTAMTSACSGYCCGRSSGEAALCTINITISPACTHLR